MHKSYFKFYVYLGSDVGGIRGGVVVCKGISVVYKRQRLSLKSKILNSAQIL